MIELDWRGPGPREAWVSELEAAGVVLRKPGGARAPALTVVRTNAAALPRPPTQGPWIWVPATTPKPEGETQAVLLGALDVIGADDARLVARLSARAHEASVAEPSLPECPGFIANGAASQRVLREVLRAAGTSMPVLLTGETGTGKDLAARLVHSWSTRRAKTFVPINCAAIPNELIEAELFGYLRGAFSGAVRDYEGQLRAAEGGTVFLDEIDETPPTLQTKLLRVLEDRVVSRLGQNDWHRVDFRIVAATNRDLDLLIARGQFGQDLYERLAILNVRLPPLRDRREDLPALARHFMARFYVDEPPVAGQAQVQVVSERALLALAEYRWPGNLRELRNVIFASLLRKRSGEELLLSDLPRRILERPVGSEANASLVDEARIAQRFDARRMNLRQELEVLERTALIEALRRANGRPAIAAQLLGEVGRGSARDPAGTVRAMMRRLGVGQQGRQQR